MAAIPWRRFFLVAVLALGARPGAQVVPDDSRESVLRGLLPARGVIPVARAQRECLALPVDPPNDRLQGPHGDTLISSRCDVGSFEDINAARPGTWSAAQYKWVSIFSPEGTSQGKDARETVTEEEAVLFEVVKPGSVRPVWHARIESDGYGVWRSVTPEIGATTEGTVLLSVMMCVNGTGGCNQEFLHRHADGRWFAVRQTWFDQLPSGYFGRIRHGVRIDPRTLRAVAGFYGDEDPNCCPSQTLIADLTVQRDALVLQSPPQIRPAHQ
jgi:hypothetical protein